jgi:hypothetical protein
VFRRQTAEGRRMLFPVRLLDMETLRNCFIPDFSEWQNHDAYSASLKRLLRDLKTR